MVLRCRGRTSSLRIYFRWLVEFAITRTKLTSAIRKTFLTEAVRKSGLFDF